MKDRAGFSSAAWSMPMKGDAEVIDCDLEAEHAARTLCTEAREACRDARDHVSMQMFAELLVDEEEHIGLLEILKRLIDQIGIQNDIQLQSRQLQSRPADEADKSDTSD